MRIFNKDLYWFYRGPVGAEQVNFPEFTLEVLRPLEKEYYSLTE